MANLTRLRSLMVDSSYVGKALQAYIIPNCDAHQSEYIGPVDYRTHTVSGVYSRKAAAVVTSTKAAVWTNAVFYEQAMKDIDDKNWTLLMNGLPEHPTMEELLIKELPPKSRIGINPLYLSFDSWKVLKKILSVAGHTLVPVSRDLVDVIREEQGIVFKSDKKLFVMDIKYAGKSWQEKIEDIREHLKRKFAVGLLISKLDELAWLFNLRGGDIPYNPVFYGFALVTVDDISLFVDESKITDEVRVHLGCEGNNNNKSVNIRPYEEIKSAVSKLSTQKRTIWMSPDVNAAIAMLVDENDLWIELTPVGRRKVIKNAVEIQCMKDCHIRDAVALCEFWSWLEQEIPTSHVTEVSAADQLEKFCKQQYGFIDSCFKTTSYFGDGKQIDSSGAGKTISDEGLYINASGRHYKDGTTNITRVMHYGTPSPWHQECYTRVLKGHINLAKVFFPTKTTGHSLDAFARKALWDVGLDYLSFTGHGVGHLLHVMEGPYGFSNQSSPLELPLSDGMFVTIEPCYYEDGNFKIRLENMFVVRPVELKNNHKNRGYLKFEPVSFLPFSRKLMVMSLLTKDEIEWLNDYHAECVSRVAPALEEQGKKRALDWLMAETRPLEIPQ